MNRNQIDDLLGYVQKEGRICPLPDKWNQLWKTLPNKRRVGSSWIPPLPLILAAWDHSSSIEKMLRLKQHIEYAAKHGVLDKVETYLKNLPTEDWYKGNN